MKISLQKKLENRFQDILNNSPYILKEYFLSSFNGHPINQNLYKRFSELAKFLRFIKTSLQKELISVKELEELPIELVEDYIQVSTSVAAMKPIVSILQSFFDYYTVYSYDINKRRPIFYRNVISEWKVAFDYDKRIKHLKDKQIEFPLLNLDDFKNILFYYDNDYVLYLHTPAKIENWKKNKNRNIAMIALLMGTGIRLEELQGLNLEDIDLRKKEILVRRGSSKTRIEIQDFALPYLKEYVSWRRKWYSSDSSERALFINSSKMRVSVSLATSIISSISKTYHLKFTATSIRRSYERLLLDITGDILAIKENQGYRYLNSLEKIMIS